VSVASGYPSIPLHLGNLAVTHPAALALLDVGGEVTYRELGLQIDRTGQALLASGLSPGSRVGLALQPSIPYVVVILAAMAAGLVPVPLNTRLTAVETLRFLDPVGVDVVIADADHAQFAAESQRSTVVMEDAVAALPLRQRLWPFGGVDVPELPPVDPRLAALILPTGGTSGVPKGVWFDHGALWRSVAAAALNLPRRAGDRDLYFAPFFHIMFPAQLLYSLFMGGTTEILPGFDAAQSLDALARGVTRLGGAPTLMTRLRQHPAFPTTRRDQVTQVLFGAAPASAEFIRQLLGDYPSASVISLYGATEFGGPVCSIPHDDLASGRLDGVGYAWPGQRVRIVDGEGRLCRPGEVGYFNVRSMGQANGYWGRPQETADTFRPDGVRVGDMGWVDEEGRFFLVGRDNEMITTGGENVFPTEVELVLAAHPAVSEALVFGVPDPDWGCRVEALVVRDGDRDVAEGELRDFARQRLAGYKLPKVVRFVASVPITANSKPDRKAAQRLAVDLDASREHN
jgi:fatty-acyl-CoA synthase